MALRQIREEGEEILRKKSREVEIDEITGEKIQNLIDDMIETMRVNDGAGLAAVQVGILKRIIVVEVENTKLELINPVIVEQEGSQICEEGCLSLPNQFYNVKRPKKIKVKALDRNFNEVEIEAEGLLAVVLCHEIDHLDGILFIDKLYKGEE